MGGTDTKEGVSTGRLHNMYVQLKTAEEVLSVYTTCTCYLNGDLS